MWDVYVILQILHLKIISLWFFPVTHLPIAISNSFLQYNLIIELVQMIHMLF